LFFHSKRKNKSLGSVCVKLDTNQKQILCENQQLNLENEALREKICEQKGNLTALFLSFISLSFLSILLCFLLSRL
jgi:hypothetical protein